ncbi:hypothetical protein SFRURICE_013075 [Spodoptera frugiperda]|nr:hypothetical protein SFRURICE_013075 [Spodoptera frugiperda]
MEYCQLTSLYRLITKGKRSQARIIRIARILYDVISTHRIADDATLRRENPNEQQLGRKPAKHDHLAWSEDSPFLKERYSLFPKKTHDHDYDTRGPPALHFP